MGLVEKIMADKEEFTPPKGGGFNVVGVDTYDAPGEALFFVSNHPTREEAEAVRAKREKEMEEADEEGVRYYVYGPRGE